MNAPVKAYLPGVLTVPSRFRRTFMYAADRVDVATFVPPTTASLVLFKSQYAYAALVPKEHIYFVQGDQEWARYLYGWSLRNYTRQN